jgi:hypothetical protein
MSHPQLLKRWSNCSPHPKGITPRFFEMGTEKIGNFFCSHLKKSCEKRAVPAQKKSGMTHIYTDISKEGFACQTLVMF